MSPKDSGPVGHALADPTLLRKIDELYACGTGEYVDLPQLVVVGDQSSGKSSVLEGLTKVNFPRDSGLCTRFMTQIIFRREVKLRERKISASLIPSSDSSADEQQSTWSWTASGLQFHGLHRCYRYRTFASFCHGEGGQEKILRIYKRARLSPSS